MRRKIGRRTEVGPRREIGMGRLSGDIRMVSETGSLDERLNAPSKGSRRALASH